MGILQQQSSGCKNEEGQGYGEVLGVGGGEGWGVGELGLGRRIEGGIMFFVLVFSSLNL